MAIEVRAGLANPAIRVIPVLVDGHIDDMFERAAASGHPTAGPMDRYGSAGLQGLDDAAAEQHLASVADGPYRALTRKATGDLIENLERRGDTAGARRARERLEELRSRPRRG